MFLPMIFCLPLAPSSTVRWSPGLFGDYIPSPWLPLHLELFLPKVHNAHSHSCFRSHLKTQLFLEVFGNVDFGLIMAACFACDLASSPLLSLAVSLCRILVFSALEHVLVYILLSVKRHAHQWLYRNNNVRILSTFVDLITSIFSVFLGLL